VSTSISIWVKISANSLGLTVTLPIFFWPFFILANARIIVYKTFSRSFWSIFSAGFASQGIINTNRVVWLDDPTFLPGNVFVQHTSVPTPLKTLVSIKKLARFLATVSLSNTKFKTFTNFINKKIIESV
jgi:hypothetical protein